MSIEYSARFSEKLSVDFVQQLMAGIAEYPKYSVLKRAKFTLSLGAKNRVQRDTWAEDIGIQIDPEKIYLAFHSATRQEREEFLSFINRLLQKYGIHVELEEL